MKKIQINRWWKQNHPSRTNEEADKPEEERKSLSSELDEVVFILDSSHTIIKRVKVRTDIQDINYIEVLSGLKAGDEVVTGPYSLISKSLEKWR